MVISNLKTVSPRHLVIPCAGPGLQAPEGEEGRCLGVFVVEVPWSILRRGSRHFPRALHQETKDHPLGSWIVSHVTNSRGEDALALLCPACAAKAYTPEQLADARRFLS